MVIHPENLRCVDRSGVWTYTNALRPQQCKILANLALTQAKTGALRGSHHFGGRFENLYWDEGRPDLLEQLITAFVAVGAMILQRPETDLRAGGWFNLAAPGQKTSMHDHAENDELMSAVYYLSTPIDSGNLVIETDETTIELRPTEGLMVLFDPSLPHSVKTNLSDQDRLSYAGNIGPKS